MLDYFLNLFGLVRRSEYERERFRALMKLKEVMAQRDEWRRKCFKYLGHTMPQPARPNNTVKELQKDLVRANNKIVALERQLRETSKK